MITVLRRPLTWGSITVGLPYADRMDDSDLLARIREMVDAEHQLRRQMQENPGEISDAAERLRDLEESLDQCWDLLRQRRAHREFAQDPDESHARPRQQVEGYLQ